MFFNLEHQYFLSHCKIVKLINSVHNSITGLHSLDDDVISSLLAEVRDGHLSIKKLNEKCKNIKKMNTIKRIFVRQVGEKNWQEAVSKYPQHANEDQLECLSPCPSKRKDLYIQLSTLFAKRP